jgi:hypothetical protein
MSGVALVLAGTRNQQIGGNKTGEIGEMYSLLTFGFRIPHAGFSIFTYTHHFMTSLFVTPGVSDGSYYTHLGLHEL